MTNNEWQWMKPNEVLMPKYTINAHFINTQDSVLGSNKRTEASLEQRLYHSIRSFFAKDNMLFQYNRIFYHGYGISLGLQSININSAESYGHSGRIHFTILREDLMEEMVALSKRTITNAVNEYFSQKAKKQQGNEVVPLVDQNEFDNLPVLNILSTLGRYGLNRKTLSYMKKHCKNPSNTLSKSVIGAVEESLEVISGKKDRDHIKVEFNSTLIRANFLIGPVLHKKAKNIIKTLSSYTIFSALSALVPQTNTEWWVKISTGFEIQPYYKVHFDNSNSEFKNIAQTLFMHNETELRRLVNQHIDYEVSICEALKGYSLNSKTSKTLSTSYDGGVMGGFMMMLRSPPTNEEFYLDVGEGSKKEDDPTTSPALVGDATGFQLDKSLPTLLTQSGVEGNEDGNVMVTICSSKMLLGEEDTIDLVKFFTYRKKLALDLKSKFFPDGNISHNSGLAEALEDYNPEDKNFIISRLKKVDEMNNEPTFFKIGGKTKIIYDQAFSDRNLNQFVEQGFYRIFGINPLVDPANLAQQISTDTYRVTKNANTELADELTWVFNVTGTLSDSMDSLSLSYSKSKETLNDLFNLSIDTTNLGLKILFKRLHNRNLNEQLSKISVSNYLIKAYMNQMMFKIGDIRSKQGAAGSDIEMNEIVKILGDISDNGHTIFTDKEAMNTLKDKIGTSGTLSRSNKNLIQGCLSSMEVQLAKKESELSQKDKTIAEKESELTKFKSAKETPKPKVKPKVKLKAKHEPRATYSTMAMGGRRLYSTASALVPVSPSSPAPVSGALMRPGVDFNAYSDDSEYIYPQHSSRDIALASSINEHQHKSLLECKTTQHEINSMAQINYVTRIKKGTEHLDIEGPEFKGVTIKEKEMHYALQEHFTLSHLDKSNDLYCVTKAPHFGSIKATNKKDIKFVNGDYLKAKNKHSFSSKIKSYKENKERNLQDIKWKEAVFAASNLNEGIFYKIQQKLVLLDITAGSGNVTVSFKTTLNVENIKKVNIFKQFFRRPLRFVGINLRVGVSTVFIGQVVTNLFGS